MFGMFGMFPGGGGEGLPGHSPSPSPGNIPNIPNILESNNNTVFRGAKSTRKIPPERKNSSEQAFLNNFCWVPDSHHRENGKVHANFSKRFAQTRCFFGTLGFWVGFWASMFENV